MKALHLLRNVGLNPDEPISFGTAEEAMEYLLEAIEEYCPDLEVDKMTHEDIKSLLNSYVDCVIKYHPENYHQERGALLNNFEMLRRYGLTDDDYNCIDFC